MISASKHQINPVGIVLINGDGVYGILSAAPREPVESEARPGITPYRAQWIESSNTKTGLKLMTSFTVSRNRGGCD